MKRAILWLTTVAVLGSAAVGMAENNGTSGVRILAPSNGAVVGETFELKYELQNAAEGQHAHVYLEMEGTSRDSMAPFRKSARETMS